MFDRFWVCLWLLAGVFVDSDAVKSVSVMEGDSVTLQANTELQTDYVIAWTFGQTLIAQIDKKDGIFSTFDVLDGRFRDRLKLDHQTGSLTITNTRTIDSGLYEVEIIIGERRDTTYRFNVTVSGVFADLDAVKSVMEGDSVTLQTNAEIKTNDVITWTFGLSETRIAEIDKKTRMFSISASHELMCHFNTELVLKSLSFCICGLKQLKMFDRFWFCLFLWLLVGVFADSDAVKSGSVMEGDSVTLQTNTELQSDYVILWAFGQQQTLIGQIIKQAGIFSTFDVLDGRFRDRLKMDHQTGSLTITNTRTTDSGLYEVGVIVGRRRDTTYRFNVTVSGVFADLDAVKSVSVMEGDSVTLQTNTELQTEDRIMWTFGISETRIADIDKKTRMFSMYDVLDGRFRDRLKLDHQTGSLTITNTRTTDSGLYQVIISSRKARYRFNVTVSGVFADSDAVKSVSVMEGDSVTLESGVTEIQTDELLMWTFGHPETRIAQIYKETGIFSTYDGVDGKFRDRLELDRQNGSLTIRNTKTTDTGLYQIFTRSRKETTYRFNFTVYAHLPVPVISKDCSSSSYCSLLCSVFNVSQVTLSWYKENYLLSSIIVSDLSISLSLPLEVEYEDKNIYSCVINNPIRNQTQRLNISKLCNTCPGSVHCCSTEAMIRLVLSALVGVATVIILVYDIRCSRAEQDGAHIHTRNN
ncbi:uncharacterized protein LOC127161070 [Labeo rohita]|uniref:uncharacterized protein LOC127161070 n=1 Tax=Labeo rohita TaxID=84645 RepID=UPI0021E28416|nr:uncharacterized protein LOC127161070 [Labeo rohita]